MTETIEGDSLLAVRFGRDIFSQVIQDIPQYQMSSDQTGRILQLLGQGEQLLRQFEPGLVVSSSEVNICQSKEHRKELKRLIYSLAKLSCLCVGLLGFW